MTPAAMQQRLREKRRVRNLRRWAKATCIPWYTTMHRAPCGECYFCAKVSGGATPQP